MSIAEAYNLNTLSPNSFGLILPVIPGSGRSDPFILSVFSCNLPSITLSSTGVRWQGGTTHITGAVSEWGQLNVNFIVSEKLENWLALFKWMITMHNNKDTYVAERKDYSIDGTLALLDNWKKPVYAFKFINLFPTTLSELPLSSRDGARNIDASVGFSYDSFELLE